MASPGVWRPRRVLRHWRAWDPQHGRRWRPPGGRSPVLAISGEVARSWEGMGGFQDASGAGIDDIDALGRVTGLSLSLSSRAVVPHHLRHAITHALTRRIAVPICRCRSMCRRRRSTAEWQPVPGVVRRARLSMRRRSRRRSICSTRQAIRTSSCCAVRGAARQWRRSAAGVRRAVRYSRSRPRCRARDDPRSPSPRARRVRLWGLAMGDRCDPLRRSRHSARNRLRTSQRDTMQWDPKMLPSKAMIHIDADPLTHRPYLGQRCAGGGQCRRSTCAALPLSKMSRAWRPGARNAGAFLGANPSSGAAVLYQPEDMCSDAVPMHPARVVAELRAAFPDNGVLCVDSGAHRAWFAEYWDIRQPGTHISLTNLGPHGRRHSPRHRRQAWHGPSGR